MASFTGILNIFGGQSFLAGDLIRRVGIPDLGQSIAAATDFLENGRNLSSGQLITVIGTKNSQHQILMGDAHAALQPSDVDFLEEPFGVTADSTTVERSVVSKKSGGAKTSRKTVDKSTRKSSIGEKQAKASDKKTAKASDKKTAKATKNNGAENKGE